MHNKGVSVSGIPLFAIQDDPQDYDTIISNDTSQSTEYVPCEGWHQFVLQPKSDNGRYKSRL